MLSFLIFKYGLPAFVPYRSSAVFADCVILSRRHVVVLEFQDDDIIALEPARRLTSRLRFLCSRIRKYHDQSRGMEIHGILVSAARTGFLCYPFEGIAYCSADKLGEELLRILGPEPAVTHYRRLTEWMQSTYSDPADDYYAKDKEDSFML